jgi:hypothetical protein
VAGLSRFLPDERGRLRFRGDFPGRAAVTNRLAPRPRLIRRLMKLPARRIFTR